MELKKHIQIVRLVLRYLAGQLNTAEQDQLDDWINRSERNRAYFQKWRDETQQDRLLEKLSAYDTADGWQAVLHRRSIRKRQRWTVAAASIILLIGGIGLLHYLQQPSSPIISVQEAAIQPGKRMARLLFASGEAVNLDTLQQMEKDNLKVCRQQGTFVLKTHNRTHPKSQPEYHSIEVPDGGEFGIQLSDGTHVFLNAGSRLRFPEYFIPGQERRIYLSGEAYFDVARDTTSPFRVYLKHTAVKVLGTSFNVMAYPEEAREVVTLVQGAVAMKQTDIGKELILTPGEQGSYDNIRQTLTQQKVETSYYTLWKDGVFAFHKQPLGQVMKTLGRWYLFEVHYTDPTLSNILYTGKIARHATIEEVLHTFELMDELRFDVQGKKITVSKK